MIVRRLSQESSRGRADDPHLAMARATIWLRIFILLTVVLVGATLIRNITGAIRDGVYGHASLSTPNR